MSTEKLLERVKKLLALANNEGASQAEAENAMQKANKLLLTHNLTMEDVDTDEKVGVTHEHNAMMIIDHNYEGVWERDLIGVIAHYNMCTSIVYPVRGLKQEKITLVGQQHNIDIVKYLFNVAKNKFRELSRQKCKEYRKERIAEIREEHPSLKAQTTSQFEKMGLLTRRNEWLRSYLSGCAKGLGIKLHQQRESTKTEADKVNKGKFEVMIVDNEKMIKDYVANEFGKLGKASSGKSSNNSSFQQGLKDGKTTNLNKGIDGKSGPIKMLS